MPDADPLTPTGKKILLFFQEHPHAVETARGISTWLGASPDVVGKALDDLVERKWLLTHETSVVVGYTLTGDEKLVAQIRSVLSAP